MTNLNIDKGGGGSSYISGSPSQNTADVTHETSVRYTDGQAQADDFSLLTTGGNDKIPIIPTLSSDPRANTTDQTKKEAKTAPQTTPDGPVVTKESSNKNASGLVLSPDTNPSNYQDLSQAGVVIAESEVVGRNPTIVEFMKIIQDAIENLKKQLYEAQMGGGGQMSSNSMQAQAFVNAFLTASKADPRLADLVLVRAELEGIKAEHMQTAGSKVDLDLSQFPDVVNVIWKKYGLSPPMGWSKVNVYDMSRLIDAIDQEVTKQAQTHGILGKTLESVVSTSIFGFMPMISVSSPVFKVLHLRNALLDAGFTGGVDPEKDQAVLEKNPDIAKALGKWSALPSGDPPDFKDVLAKIERVATITAETTTVTTNDVLYLRAPGSYDLEVQEAKNFLDSIGPINDEVNNLMSGDVAEELNNSRMSDAAKQRVKGVVAGLLGQSLLTATVNPEGGSSPVNYIEQAIAGLMESGAISRLGRIFLADAPNSVIDASTAKREPRYKGKKNMGDLPLMEKFVFKTLKYASEHYNSTYGYVKADWEFVNRTLPRALENLSKINPEYIPEIFDILRNYPGIAKLSPNCQKLLDEEPWDIVGRTTLGRNPDDLDPGDAERKLRYKGVKHQGPLTEPEQSIVNALQRYRDLKKYHVAHYGPDWNPVETPDERFMRLDFPNLMNNVLPTVDPSHIPEIYDFLRKFPDLQEKYPVCLTIATQEPWDVYNTQSEDEMIQEAIKMLQKILANLTSGGTKIDLGELRSTLSETMGLTEVVSGQSLLSNQMM